ncbi:MAG: hypothetical protein RML46_06695 [Anaerolineae bacterium]|nr:hypothetical protein [Anaerolineae bacterium]
MESLVLPAGQALSSLAQSIAYAAMLSMPLALLFALHDAAENTSAPPLLKALLRTLITAFFPFAFCTVYLESSSLLIACTAPSGAFFLALQLLARLPSLPPTG